MTPTSDGIDRVAPFRSPTEDRNPRTSDIDRLSPAQIVSRILDEDTRVLPAVDAAAPEIAKLVEIAATSIRSGGRVHYIGAGTSGRLGVLDAVELLPTYGVGTEWFTASIAGGQPAMFRSAEGAEDDPALGAADLNDVGTHDLVIGLAASGRTPYVQGAIDLARSRGATTALVTANPHASLIPLVDVAVVLDTGAEAITGSTRMKAATAQKIALNAFSTATMVALGKTYSNLMVDVSPSNEKLRIRVARLLTQAADIDMATAEHVLDAAGGDVKTAILILLAPHGDTVDTTRIADARAALEAHGGSVRDALREFVTAP